MGDLNRSNPGNMFKAIALQEQSAARRRLEGANRMFTTGSQIPPSRKV